MGKWKYLNAGPAFLTQYMSQICKDNKNFCVSKQFVNWYAVSDDLTFETDSAVWMT